MTNVVSSSLMLHFVIEINNKIWSWAHLSHIQHGWDSIRYGTAVNNFSKKKQKYKSMKKG